MKTLLRTTGFVYFLLALLAPCGFAAEPTLDETKAWLKQKIVEHGEIMYSVRGDRVAWHHVDTITSIEFVGSIMSVKMRKYDWHPGYFRVPFHKDTNFFVVRVNLSDLDPASYALRNHYLSRDHASIFFFCPGQAKKVETVDTGRPSGPKRDFSFNIDVEGGEIADRIGKALKHAITLSGGISKPKNEPF